MSVLNVEGSGVVGARLGERAGHPGHGDSLLGGRPGVTQQAALAVSRRPLAEPVLPSRRNLPPELFGAGQLGPCA